MNIWINESSVCKYLHYYKYINDYNKFDYIYQQSSITMWNCKLSYQIHHHFNNYNYKNYNYIINNNYYYNKNNNKFNNDDRW